MLQFEICSRIQIQEAPKKVDRYLYNVKYYIVRQNVIFEMFFKWDYFD